MGKVKTIGSRFVLLGDRTIKQSMQGIIIKVVVAFEGQTADVETIHVERLLR